MTFKKRYFLGPIILALAVVAYILFNHWNARFEGANPLFIEHDNTSTERIEHTLWQDILDTYLEATDNGHTLFAYDAVDDEDRASLQVYLKQLQQVDPTQLNQKEQFSYWINLYNALTVDLVIEHYPVDSIRDIGKVVKLGPWDEPLARVNGQSLSLNNIEHGILRPIYKDSRVHYLINCASFGCPNLPLIAVTANSLDEQLNQAAQDFINHSKGVNFSEGKLTVSSIYNWFASDFGKDENALMEHLKEFSNQETLAQLNAYQGEIHYDYDWLLNDAYNE